MITNAHWNFTQALRSTRIKLRLRLEERNCKLARFPYSQPWDPPNTPPCRLDFQSASLAKNDFDPNSWISANAADSLKETGFSCRKYWGGVSGLQSTCLKLVEDEYHSRSQLAKAIDLLSKEIVWRRCLVLDYWGSWLRFHESGKLLDVIVLSRSSR